jgi:hypothetical protein
MPGRNTNRRAPSSSVHRGDRPSDRRTVHGGRQPTKQNPKPTGPVNIGKPINGGQNSKK